MTDKTRAQLFKEELDKKITRDTSEIQLWKIVLAKIVDLEERLSKLESEN